jgi:hypothetical protein
VFSHEIDRSRLQFGKNLADILADNADHDELHAADGHQADHQRRIAGHGFSAHPGFPQDGKTEQEGDGGEEHAEQAGETQRRHRERCQAFDRKPDQLARAERSDAMGAGRRFVVDADLAKADPARQPLEKAIALGKLPQRGRGPRRQQAEIAGVRRYFLPRAPIDQCVEALHGDAPQP